MPPSSDDLPGRKPPERQGRRGTGKNRKPGKQPGAPGVYLAWNDRPDMTVPHFPGACACGEDLAAASDLGVRYSHQFTDLPEARAQTTQHDRHEVQCSCGRTDVADVPPEASGAPGTVTYGLNLVQIARELGALIHQANLARASRGWAPCPKTRSQNSARCSGTA